MIRRRVRDDRIPDDSLVHQFCSCGIWPACRHPHENLLGVPVEERGEVSGEGEFDDGVFFFAGGVVVWSASYSGHCQLVI